MGGILVKILLTDNKDDLFSNKRNILTPNMLDSRNLFKDKRIKYVSKIMFENKEKPKKISQDYIVISKQEKITMKCSDL